MPIQISPAETDEQQVEKGPIGLAKYLAPDEPDPAPARAVRDAQPRLALVPMPADHIARTQTIDGVVTPAFIHNSGYFFVNLQVYADGLVNCWELLDLPLFRGKLSSGWVVTSVPDGKAISIHGLGNWKVASGAWQLDGDALYDRVTALVRGLNPRMENLHDCHGQTTELVGKVNRSILGSPREMPVRLARPDALFKERIPGESLSVFVRDDDYQLADLRVFKDGAVELGRLASTETLDRAGLSAAVRDGRIVTTLPAGSRVRIHGLGSFVAAEEHSSVDIHELLRDVSDRVDKLNGRAGSVQRCRDAYKAYAAEPSEALREELRMAYESVPEHNRMYVGDMDTRDVAVRMVLYGEQEIESWSHRRLARSKGLPLPEIRVPKPKG